MSGDALTDRLVDHLVERVAERAAEIVLARLDTGRDAPELLTVPEAAQLLRCSRGRVDNLLTMRRLPRVKEGRRTLIRRADVLAYLASETARHADGQLPRLAVIPLVDGVRGRGASRVPAASRGGEG